MTMNDTIEDMLVFVRRRLKEEGRGRWTEIGENARVGVRTIERIAYSAPHSSRYEAVRSLANVLGYPVPAPTSEAA